LSSLDTKATGTVRLQPQTVFAEPPVMHAAALRHVPAAAGQLDGPWPVALEAGGSEHGVVPVRRPDAVGVAWSRRPVQHPVGELDADVGAEPPQVSLRVAQEIRGVDDGDTCLELLVGRGLL